MSNFFDVYELSLNKQGEELCGDKVKVLKTLTRTIIVLSDGLGSGVKASILATLTTEIIMTMLKAEAALTDVIETVIGTLPICQVRKIAYATFTIIEIENSTGNFKMINFDNPPLLYFKNGKKIELEKKTEKILDKQITLCSGVLERGDFLGLMSDGVLYAGLGTTLNFGWGWQNVAEYVEKLLVWQPHAARDVVVDVIAKTRSLYRDNIGDDTTFVGVYARSRNALIIFTGPPLNPETDAGYIEKVLNFEGRRVICGGTTGNIVADYLGETVDIDLSTLRKEVPPIGALEGFDLLTEGIITISKCLDYLKTYGAHASRLPADRNAAVLLAREILRADFIYFLVGQKVNEFYQSPLLPQNLSIRKTLIKDLAGCLAGMNKDIEIEYC